MKYINILCADCGHDVYYDCPVDKLPPLQKPFYNCNSIYCQGTGIKYAVQYRIANGAIDVFISNDPLLEDPSREYERMRACG